MKMGIFFRSTASFLIVLFLLGASNVFAILKLVELNAFILDSQNADIRLLDAEKKLVDSLFSQQRYEQKYLLTKDAVLHDQFIAAERDFERLLDEIASVPISPAKKEAFARIKAYHQRYRSLVNDEVTNLKENRRYDKNLYKEEKEKTSNAILDELERLENYPSDDVIYKTKMAAEAGISARSVAITSLLVTVLLAILLSLLFTRSITRPLMELVSKTREISTGTFTCDLDLSAPPEIRELAEAFNSMCDKLKEVDKMKSDFFSMISHELRTPLTTIKEGTSLLLEGEGGSMTEKQGKLLAIISAESNRLMTLVNSILDLSKMEAGMMTYTFGQENIIPLIDQAMTGIMPYAEAKKIRLRKQIEVAIPLWRMDQERILEVLRNLIGNAVKFTPEGGLITIAANLVSDGLQVSVSDTGPGILKENLAVIFEKYKSSDPKRGTGLGLAMVKHIVAAHGGRVWAESEPGKGSKFIFVLPS